MSSRFTYFTIILISLSFASGALAEQTLTLSLETPAISSTKSQSEPTPGKPQERAKTEQSVKLGKVGVVQVDPAFIYKSKSPGSGKYATLKPDTPLVIVKEDGEWLGILMSNGSTGWIPAKNVRYTGYELIQKPGTNRGNTVSRGNMEDRMSSLGESMIRSAMKYQGVRYVFGGTSPATGMDCSAFVRMIFKEYGVSLPRTSREQALVGNEVPFDQLKPGDRLYFACKNPHIDHCGIYAGNGYFVHCSSSRGGVGVDTLNSSFFGKTLVTARRS